VAFGDAALLVELDTVTSIAGARRARRLAAAIDVLRADEAAIEAPVAAAASVLVPFDPERLDPAGARHVVDAALAAVRDAPVATDPGPLHEIPVRYGSDDGPDLETVAAELGLRPPDVVELHAGTTYEVLFLGFAPGFAYLGEVQSRLFVPRLATPRVRVPAGSVAIAGAMTAVYPHASPGGWRILGRTDTVMFDTGAAPPARLRPGDRVRFVPSVAGHR
jgi:KipI family sensor histidine kinase inhibitor